MMLPVISTWSRGIPKSFLPIVYVVGFSLVAGIGPAQAACGIGKLPTYSVEAIRYERTNCFGQCPSYQVLFTSYLGCYYLGFQNVSKHDTFESSCSDQTVRRASLVLMQHDFFNMNCDPSVRVQDAPHYIVSVERCGVTTSLNWPSHGERTDIKSLFNDLDFITKSLKWSKTNASLEPPLPLLVPVR